MTPTRLSDSVFQKNVKGHGHKVKMFGMVGNVLTQGRHSRSMKSLCLIARKLNQRLKYQVLVSVERPFKKEHVCQIWEMFLYRFTGSKQ